MSKTEELKALCLRLGKRYVGGRGNPKAPIWLVGEAPGADEDQAGVPFVGASGRELDKMLQEAGISLGDCYFTNPYKVRPPDNDIERIEETGITRGLFEEQFFEEITTYRPTFIVPLGGTPLGVLCPDTRDTRDKEFKISKWRGSLLISSRLGWTHYCIPNFHPAYVLREWSDRDVSVFIFGRLKEELDYWRANGKLCPLPERELITTTDFNTRKEFLYDLLADDKPISLDIELLSRRVPICIAASNNPKRALSCGLFDDDPGHQAVLWRLIERILATKRIIGQNWTTFDSNWMGALGFSSGVARCDDTLVLHHVLYPELSHKLDFIGMQFTRQPYWKDEGRGWQAREGMTKLMRYNALDSAVTLEAYEEMSMELAQNPSLSRFYFEYEMPLARAFHLIDQKGILVDQVLLAELRKEIVAELGDRCVAISKNLGNRPVVYSQKQALAMAKMLTIDAKSILNIASVPQLKDVLKNDLRIKLRLDRKTHKESTGEESLNEAFAATQSPVLKDILRTRRTQ